MRVSSKELGQAGSRSLRPRTLEGSVFKFLFPLLHIRLITLFTTEAQMQERPGEMVPEIPIPNSESKATFAVTAGEFH